MKTILIPIDLIGDTENVLQYAAGFACDVHVEHIILLKSYYVSVYEQVLPTPDFVQLSNEEVEEHRQILEANLKALAAKMQKTCTHTVKIETAFSSLPLLRAVHNTVIEKQPNMVMMGSDSSTHEPGSYLGEQLVAVGRTSPVPVMVIPENALYQKIERVLVPCDFSAISRLSALKGFHAKQRWPHPHLLVLNVDAKHHFHAGNKQVTENLAEMLEGYAYDVHHSSDADIVRGVLAFATHNDVQLIIALPGQYSFFYNLTHRNITIAITLNATSPVLILK